MKKVAVLTSGGDAPGMNAAIRAVTRMAIEVGSQVIGIRHGFQGLLTKDKVLLDARSVGGIIERGGTFLGSSRSPEFETEGGRKKALAFLSEEGINGLVVIGGNGSQAGADFLGKAGFPVVGVASTIDNDLPETDITLGVDTAVNTALEAIDRIKTTASAHNRAFLVEVMGRECGYLALISAIAGGAEVVAIPELPLDPEEIARELRAAYDRGKAHAIAVIAEGCRLNASGLAAWFKEHQERIGFDLRVTTLGHIQRGGAPTAFDRLLATRMGAEAVKSLHEKESGVLIGLSKGEIRRIPFADVVGRTKVPDLKLLTLARILAR